MFLTHDALYREVGINDWIWQRSSLQFPHATAFVGRFALSRV